MRRLLAAALSLLLLSACKVSSSESGTSPGVSTAPSAQTPSGQTATGRTVASYFSPPQAYPGPKWTKDGRAVDGRELNSIAGPDHCEWQSAVIMHLGWPLGTVAETSVQARQFIRDPVGVIDQGLRARLALGVALPADARATGYRQGDLELWLSPSNEDAAYLRVDNDVERWPRAVDMKACM